MLIDYLIGDCDERSEPHPRPRPGADLRRDSWLPGSGIRVMATRKPRIRYGILDCFGEVIRWVLGKPSRNYRYITRKEPPGPVIDWDSLGPGLY